MRWASRPWWPSQFVYVRAPLILYNLYVKLFITKQLTRNYSISMAIMDDITRRAKAEFDQSDNQCGHRMYSGLKHECFKCHYPEAQMIWINNQIGPYFRHLCIGDSK